MSEAVLTVDCGNTTIDVRWSSADGDDGARRRTARLADFEAFLASAPAGPAVVVSVVESRLQAVRAALARAAREVFVVGQDLTCPLRIDYPEPATLGADRWVAAVGAQERSERAFVIDCGTAVTVDAVGDGRFFGGAIAPGLGTLAAGLSQAAPALPGFEAVEVTPPTITSAEAVAFGVGEGFVAMVDGLLDRMRDAVAFGGATTFVTGGDAEFYVGRSTRATERIDDLVHEGLRCLLTSSRAS